MLDDDCQSVSEVASHEYQGWHPGLLDEQLYLSSSRIQKAVGPQRRTQRTESMSDDGRLGIAGTKEKHSNISLNSTKGWHEGMARRPRKICHDQIRIRIRSRYRIEKIAGGDLSDQILWTIT